MKAKEELRPKPPAKMTPPVTRGDGLAERLADDITSGVFAPGCRLDETSMANRYGTSRTPVREALRQLEAAGLVERRPYRGAVVSAPSPERLAEMLVAAGEIEGNCARLAALAMNAAERAVLRRLHDKMGDLAQAGNKAAYCEANMAWHERIYAGARNGTLESFARDLRRRLMPFRRGQFQTTEHLTESFAEHEAIVKEIERGRGDEAAELMRHHLRLTETAFEGSPAP